MGSKLKQMKFGWFGDGGHGDRVIAQIVQGKKTATLSLGYETDGADIKVGDKLEIVDKHGKGHGVILITRIDKLLFGSVTEELAVACGHTLGDLKELAAFANAREIGPQEEMRATYFELAKVSNLPL
jgi:uncharacterized protein YhfF